VSGPAFEDEALRRLALDRLGAYGHALAREALESGAVEVEPGVLAWVGTSGTVHGHRVTVRVEPGLAARVNAAPSALDALTASVAAAMATRGGHALAELAVAPGAARRATPYRG
jgi:hypothetical protein